MTQAIAAHPEEKAIANLPFSQAARHSSKAVLVGVPPLAYSYCE